MSFSLNVPILTAKSFYTGYKFKKYVNSLSSVFTTDKFSAFTTDLRLAKILKTELSKRALKYTHFELKSIVIQENKFPRLIDLWLFYISIFNDLTVLRLSAAFENN